MIYLLVLFKAGVCYYIGSNFVGALAHTDDIVFIAPTVIASRNFFIICDECARDYRFEPTALGLEAKHARFWLSYMD